MKMDTEVCNRMEQIRRNLVTVVCMPVYEDRYNIDKGAKKFPQKESREGIRGNQG